MGGRLAGAADGAAVDGVVVAVAVRVPGRVLRERLAGLLPQVSGEEAARPAAPSGSPAGDCLAVLDAVTRGLRRFPGMAGLAACEAAAHLSAALWLAPGVPSLRFNTSLLPVAVKAVS